MVHCLKPSMDFFPAPVHYTGPPPSADGFHVSLSLSLSLSVSGKSSEHNTHTTRSPCICSFCHPIQYNNRYRLYIMATKCATNSPRWNLYNLNCRWILYSAAASDKVFVRYNKADAVQMTYRYRRTVKEGYDRVWGK